MLAWRPNSGAKVAIDIGSYGVLQLYAVPLHADWVAGSIMMHGVGKSLNVLTAALSGCTPAHPKSQPKYSITLQWLHLFNRPSLCALQSFVMESAACPCMCV